MKKLIAILTIAIVLAGVLFATEAASASLKITSTVEKRFPGFKLEGIEQTTNTTATAKDDIRGEVAASTDIDENHGTYTDVPATLEARSIAEHDIVVDFRLYQSGSEGYNSTNSKYYAKLGNTYTFTVTVGDMILTDPTSHEQVAVLTNTNHVAKEDAVTGAATITFEKATTVTGNEIDIDDTSTGFTAVYSGIVYDDQDIGTFSVKWPQNANLDEGDYVANVVVTIIYN